MIVYDIILNTLIFLLLWGVFLESVNENLIGRAYLLIEEGCFSEAEKLCKQALNNDFQCAACYLMLLMIENKVKNKSELKNCKKPFSESANYKNLKRFGNTELVNEIDSYLQNIIDRNNTKKQKKKKKLMIALVVIVAVVVLSAIVGSVIASVNRQKALDYQSRDVGETIIFGEYDIDKDGKDKEEMEWIILDKKDDKILVVSKYAVDERVYHNRPVYVDWKHCSLKDWLNNDFYDECFSNREKSKIIETQPTNDSVFILSIDEADEYFSVLKKNRMKVPLKCYMSGTYGAPKYGWSWLRDPGTNVSSAAYFADGSVGDVFIGEVGKGVCDRTVLVRPAMWISID